jgi:insulin receptor
MLYFVVTDSADNMDQMRLTVKVANQTEEFGGEVRLQWEEPIEPNGIVVTYHIEYRRVDIQNVS